MPRWKIGPFLVLAVALALVASACGGGGGGSSGSSQSLGGAKAKKGGTVRVGVEDSFNFTGGFDPTGEYLGTAFGIYSDLMLRTLLGYDHVAGAAGNRLVPDLATSMPTVSSNGLTYTFHLKKGVKFGPPVNRPVTSKDVLYAFERIGTPRLVAQYGFYYNVIKGMAAFTAKHGLNGGPGNTISGIETPDAQTIVFHLTKPTGDFGYRVAMPATAPIPAEVAKCFPNAGDYGRDVVSTGPYMIKGANAVKLSGGCKAVKPMSGFDPNSQLILVRNPSYDPATDSKAARDNYPNEFDFTLNSNTTDIFNRVTAGNYDTEIAGVPPTVLRQYSTNGSLKQRLEVDPGDRTWYITMNLTQPPFDDIHVRKAANWVMDKAGLQRAWGGPLKGKIAGHIVPNSMFNGALSGYDPYKTPNDAGDVAKAKAEMKLSKYDSNHDGVCDAAACRNVLLVNRNTPIWVAMEPIIQNSLAKIGIHVKVREFADAYPIIQTTARNIPLSSVPGWGKDYADPSTFMVLFDSGSIEPTGNVNYSLVGVKPSMTKKLGLNAQADVRNVPNVDADIARCSALTGSSRTSCWEALDKKLMEQVVPWVPYLDANNVVVIGPAVTKWDYDQFSGDNAWAHMAVDPAKQK